MEDSNGARLQLLREVERLQAVIDQRQAEVSERASPVGNQPLAISPAAARGRGRGRGRGRAGYFPTSSVPRYQNQSWVAPGRKPVSISNLADATTPASNASSRESSTIASTGLPQSSKNVDQTTSTKAPSTVFVNGADLKRTSHRALDTASQSVKNNSKEIVIGGVTFLSDGRGNKLVRKKDSGIANSTPSTSTATENSVSNAPGISPQRSTGSHTPKKASVSGTTYVRTKSGNLVSIELVKKRKLAQEKKSNAAKKERLDKLVGIVSEAQKARNAGKTVLRGGPFASHIRDSRRAFIKASRTRSKKLCRFFQKTGQCNNGLTCPYTHDSVKVAICPLSLRGKCPNKATDCLLSHSPNPHRSPHCTYFPNCQKNGSCPYSHVHVSRDAGVCRDFAIYGWCDKGINCAERHAFECPEFSEKGICTSKGCKLPHVLRRRNTEDETANGDDAAEEVDEIDYVHGGSINDVLSESDVTSHRQKRNLEFPGISSGANYEVKRAKRTEDLSHNEDYVTLIVASSDEEDSFAEESTEDDSASIDSVDSDDETGEEVPEVQVNDGTESESILSNKVLHKDDVDPVRAVANSDRSDDEEVEQLLKFKE